MKMPLASPEQAMKNFFGRKLLYLLSALISFLHRSNSYSLNSHFNLSWCATHLFCNHKNIKVLNQKHTKCLFRVFSTILCLLLIVSLIERNGAFWIFSISKKNLSLIWLTKCNCKATVLLWIANTPRRKPYNNQSQKNLCVDCHLNSSTYCFPSSEIASRRVNSYFCLEIKQY